MVILKINKYKEKIIILQSIEIIVINKGDYLYLQIFQWAFNLYNSVMSG